MSLKAFHVLFITASVTLSFWFGWYELDRYAGTKVATDMWFGVGSCVMMDIIRCANAAPSCGYFIVRAK